MSPRILPLLGPAVVLYLVADVASVLELGVSGVAIAATAVLLSLSSFFTRRNLEEAGAKRVGLLGVALGIALVSVATTEGGPLVVRLFAQAGIGLAALLVVDLALDVPDKPRALDRGGLPRVLLAVVGGLATFGGILAFLADVPAMHVGLAAPSWWGWLPAGFALVAVLVSIPLRLFRRAMGSAPEALASNAWALLGLLLAAVALVIILALEVTGLWHLRVPASRGLMAVAALCLTAGHVTMVDMRRRLSSGPATRRVVAAAITLAVVAATMEAMGALVSGVRLGSGAAVALALLLAVLLYSLVRRAIRSLLSPFGGRLLDAVAQAESGLATATDLNGIARAVLGPIRRGSADPESAPLLFVTDPPRELRVDAAGEPREQAQEMPPALRERLLERPGEVIVRAALERLVVRRPKLRQLVELLLSLDALAIVPLSVAGEVEGALVVPRGRRRSGLSLEEIDRLEALSLRMSALVSVLCAQDRAQRRSGQGEAARKDMQERVEYLEEELTRLRADARILKAGRAAERMTEPLLAYGSAMRELMQRISQVGPMGAPVLLVAEAGTAIDRVGHRIHACSGRSQGPFVLADGAAARSERGAALLFGEEGDSPQPGWLRLAAGGALFLVDAPALPIKLQRELAEALAEKQARAVGGAGAYPVDVRIIATSRVELKPLVDAGAFDPELARWLGGLELSVPPLRERTEDIPSLVLFALDRSCRVLGREPLGIDQEALDVLVAHEWRGNLRELQWVIDQAVLRAAGPKVLREDLPGLAPALASPPLDPLDGTYAEIERRVLQRALDRAEGNKSEAARYLGLKRTTFLDKLRRVGLGDGSKSSEETAA